MNVHRALVVSLAFTACVGSDPVTTNTAAGGDAGGAADKSALPLFLGTWSTSTATQTLSNCALAGTTTDISITIEVKRGAASDILANNTLAPSCAFSATIAGDTATFAAQSCTQQFNGFTYTYAYDSTNTFKLTAADGSTATSTIKARITDGSGNYCDFTEVAPYTKD